MNAMQKQVWERRLLIAYTILACGTLITWIIYAGTR